MSKTFLCFKVHQPFRISKYSIFSVGHFHDYFIEQREIMEVLAKTCYIPATKLLIKLIEKHDDKFKFGLSISGSTLELFEKYHPDLIDLFKELINTNKVELISETYNNSLASEYSLYEFERQINNNNEILKKTFNKKPEIFLNTLGKYNSKLNQILKKHYKFVLINDESIKQISQENNLILIPYNNKLSDLINLDFSNKNNSNYPIDSEKFVKLLSEEENKNLIFDLEIMGEYHRADSGIFKFIEALPEQILKNNKFISTTEIKESKKINKIDNLIDKKDEFKTNFIENRMQEEIIYELSKFDYNNLSEEILNNLGKLQDITNIKIMSTNNFNNKPYEHFISYLNILNDLKLKIDKEKEVIIQKI